MSSFHSFLMTFATYEKEWMDFPLYVRTTLSKWRREVSDDGYCEWAEKMKRGEPVRMLDNENIPLLEELLEMVEASDYFAVKECGCRRLASNCDFPLDTCLTFNEWAKWNVEHGRARRLTKDEMRDLVIQNDRKGLIHTGRKDWRTNSPKSACSCCTCCCISQGAA